MDHEVIIKVLENWNPWKRELDAGVSRKHYTDRMYPFLQRKEIVVLKGIRRCGKSTIVRQLINRLLGDGVGRKQILYVNLEDYNFAGELRVELLEDILQAYRKYSRNAGKVFCFIDEVQKIDGWERWVRTKYDLGENIKFIVSGSSASLLSKEFSRLLTGRLVSFRVMTLSFMECVEFNGSISLNEYLKFGGFPEVVLEKSEEKKRVLLQQYFDDIIHKDIIDRHAIRNAKQVREIAQYLAGTPGSKVSANRLSRVFGLSKDTVSDYITYMLDAYLLFEVTFFSYSARTRHDVTKLPKLYALDNGLVNVASIKFSENRGKMFENAVLIRLAQESEDISYWSELKSEVDFIVGTRAINVTATDRIDARELRGLDSFREKHKRFQPMLITKSTNDDLKISLKKFLNMQRVNDSAHPKTASQSSRGAPAAF